MDPKSKDNAMKIKRFDMPGPQIPRKPQDFFLFWTPNPEENVRNICFVYISGPHIQRKPVDNKYFLLFWTPTPKKTWGKQKKRSLGLGSRIPRKSDPPLKTMISLYISYWKNWFSLPRAPDPFFDLHALCSVMFFKKGGPKHSKTNRKHSFFIFLDPTPPRKCKENKAFWHLWTSNPKKTQRK